MGRPVVKTVALLIVLGVIAAAVYIALQPTTPATIGLDTTDTSVQYRDSYSNFSFSYPSTYGVQLHEATTTANVPYRAIVIADKTALSSVPENGEGPVAISVDIFPADAHVPLPTWISQTPESNFNISQDKLVASTTISGVPAYRYRWDGLYSGESIVAQSGSSIFLFSVTYMTPSDQIRSDFEKMLQSVRF